MVFRPRNYDVVYTRIPRLFCSSSFFPSFDTRNDIKVNFNFVTGLRIGCSRKVGQWRNKVGIEYRRQVYSRTRLVRVTGGDVCRRKYNKKKHTHAVKKKKSQRVRLNRFAKDRR